MLICYIETVVMLIFSHRKEFWHHRVVGDQGGEGRVVLQESLEEEQMFMIGFYYHFVYIVLMGSLTLIL